MLRSKMLVLVPSLVLLAAGAAYAGDSGVVEGTVSSSVAKHRANTVVYVREGAKGPVKPREAVMDQRGLVFVPRVLPIQAGSTVMFLNSDPTGHNVYTVDGEKYDLGTWPAGEKRPHTFTKPGVYRQLCHVHDDMIAFIVVLDTSFYALSDKAGRFRLEGLPPGDYVLGVWHEKMAADDLRVTVTAGGTTAVTVPLKGKK